ncbi:MAG: glycoside hydrolase family 32 protein [Gammaproteobacteria bacterium]|nr:glycoside hydrolase family 32 protein [Gammaproteobacteria bacterium]
MSIPPKPCYREHHRPQFHFSPRENWINDPNGMLYYNGLYHLFYQYNPSDKAWSNMHWGHATSRDLLHWEERPVALHAEPEGLGYIYSGSAVVDWHNTTGLQQGEHPPLVAMFTHSSKWNRQVQSLAYSVDGGDNWQMYAHNPVLENPDLEDFRDPKLFWCEQQQGWVMVLAAGREVQIFRSANLKDWRYCSSFSAGAMGGVWECPDLFPLRVGDSELSKWVLLLSINPGGPNGGSATQYFIGNFDGEHFHADDDEVRWLDYGTDNYAGVTWSSMPQGDERRIMIAWMSNWLYANHVPTAPWRGAMTVPRELKLLPAAHGLCLSAAPVAELASLRRGAAVEVRDMLVERRQSLATAPLADTLDVELAIANGGGQASGWQLCFANAGGEQLLLQFDAAAGELSLDRSATAHQMAVHDGYMRKQVAPLQPAGDSAVGLRILKDASSLEIFSSDGRSLLTALYFSRAPLDQLQLSPLDDNTALLLERVAISELRSIW